MIGWTKDHCDKLTNLWNAKVSTGAIAKEFGVTRNAICGKIWRMGLSGTRPRAGIKHQKPKTTLRVVRPKMTVKPDPINDDAIPVSSRKTLLELTPFCCRWPIGEPGTDGFFFCGMGALDGHPYCPAHCERAYQPSKTERRPFIPWRKAA